MKTENRCDSRRAIANRLRAEVERETPDGKERLLRAAASCAQAGGEAPAKRRACRPALKCAVSFGLCAAVLCGAVAVPGMFRSGRAAAAPSSSGRGATMAQENPFVLEAYAAEAESGSLQAQKSFDLSVGRKISVSGIDCTKFAGQIYQGQNLLKDDGKAMLYANYQGFNLKCAGDHIETVTYSTDRGGFAQVKSLPWEEFSRISQSIPWAVENCRKQYANPEYRKAILKKDPNYKFEIPEANRDYGDGRSMEVASAGWGVEKDHIEYDGFLPVGASYTLSYKDQDDHTKQYVWRVLSSLSHTQDDGIGKAAMHAALKSMDGAVITVTAKYEDGSTAAKQCVVRLDTDKWTLRAAEIG